MAIQYQYSQYKYFHLSDKTNGRPDLTQIKALNLFPLTGVNHLFISASYVLRSLYILIFSPKVELLKEQLSTIEISVKGRPGNQYLYWP